MTSTEIGRLRKSDNPLDFALNSKGYFQYLNAEGGIEIAPYHANVIYNAGGGTALYDHFGGARLRVCVRGSGRPLLLLNGIGAAFELSEERRAG